MTSPVVKHTLLFLDRHRERNSPLLRQLRWLPLRQRIEFRLAVLVYMALNGLSPQCLMDDCQLMEV